MMNFAVRLWLKSKLKKEELVKIEEQYKEVFKLSLLVDFAVKNNVSIVVGTQTRYNLIKEMNPDINVIRMALNFTKEVRGKVDAYPNGVIIDETLHPAMIRILEDNSFNIRGGFLQNYEGGYSNED